MLRHLYFFNKLRKHIGLQNAINAFSAIRINKTGVIKMGFLKYPFRIRLNNNADSSTFNEVILRQEYDIKPAVKPARIIDGGANIGLTSVFYANKFPQASIVSVEPDAGNFALLVENTKPYANIKPMNTAIWDKNAYLKVVDTGMGDNAFAVQEVDEHTEGSFRGTSIADILKANNWDHVDLLKMDIEGSELEVFTNGYEEWLPKTKILIVETHDRYVKGSSRAVFKAISQYDFSCKIKGFNFVFTNNAI